MTYVDFVVQLSADYGYTRVLRTEEMYLILAEAYAHKTDGVATAVGYLNTLRETKFRTEVLHYKKMIPGTCYRFRKKS